MVSSNLFLKEEVTCLRFEQFRGSFCFSLWQRLQPPPCQGRAATPSGKVSIESRSIAAGIGVTWGDGKLSFKGKDYAFTIDGLSVGGLRDQQGNC